jgi:hypothetical protein
MDLLNPCSTSEYTENGEIKVPCEDGNHTLNMEWKDNDGQVYTSRVEYVNSKNGYQGT